MRKTLILAALAASFTGLSAPAQAAFYFEGLMPYTDAPNCNDPYATTCGRYGQVPHEGKIIPPKPNQMGVAPRIIEQPDPVEPKVRLRTREGLEK